MTVPVPFPVWQGEFIVTRHQEDILGVIPLLSISIASICISCTVEL